jgi:large subunit ribosomal protein L18
MATRNERRKRRHYRVRRKMQGTPERPRLSVFRSLKHIYAQVIDDRAGHTLVAASTLDPEVEERITARGRDEMTPVDQAKVVGETVGRRALDEGITRVVFDRGGYKYHGRVRAVAEGAREAGLEL